MATNPCKDAFDEWWKGQPWTSTRLKKVAWEAWLACWIAKPTRNNGFSVTDMNLIEEAMHTLNRWSPGLPKDSRPMQLIRELNALIVQKHKIKEPQS